MSSETIKAPSNSRRLLSQTLLQRVNGWREKGRKEPTHQNMRMQMWSWEDELFSRSED